MIPPDPINPSSPPLIPSGGAPSYPSAEAPLGSNSLEQTPVAGIFGAVEAILRQPRRVMFQLRQPGASALIRSLLLIAAVCAIAYGVVIGTFSGDMQYWAAPLKVTAGLFISALLCLPSLYIFSCLGGSHARLVEIFGLLAGLLALMTVLMVGFAPVALVFSTSTKSIVVMGGLHLVFWGVATIFGLRFLHAAFRHFNASSDSGLKVWVVVFLLVALQMTTALRPIVGTSKNFLPPAAEKKFFVAHWMDCINAEWPDKPTTNENRN